jgi:hypothetical protein
MNASFPEVLAIVDEILIGQRLSTSLASLDNVALHVRAAISIRVSHIDTPYDLVLEAVTLEGVEGEEGMTPRHLGDETGSRGQQPTVMLGITAERDLLARTHYYYEVPSANLQQSHLLLVM